MIVNCQFDTSVPEDKALLEKMFSKNGETPAEHLESAAKSVRAANEATKQPEPTQKPAPEPVAAEPEPVGYDDDPTEQEPEVIEAEVVEETYTMDAAVKKATALVTDGKADVVKAALQKAGSRKVSELKESDIATFMEALD